MRASLLVVVSLLALGACSGPAAPTSGPHTPDGALSIPALRYKSFQRFGRTARASTYSCRGCHVNPSELLIADGN